MALILPMPEKLKIFPAGHICSAGLTVFQGHYNDLWFIDVEAGTWLLVLSDAAEPSPGSVA